MASKKEIVLNLIMQLEERVAHLEQLGLPEDDFRNVPTTTAYTHVEEAISEWSGPRCPDYAEGCATCDTWHEFDTLVERAEAFKPDGVGFLSPYHPGDPKAPEGTKTRIIQDHIDREAGYTVESVIKPDGRNDPLVHKKYEFVINRDDEPWFFPNSEESKPYAERYHTTWQADELLHVADAQVRHLYEVLSCRDNDRFRMMDLLKANNIPNAGYDEHYVSSVVDLEARVEGYRKDLDGLKAEHAKLISKNVFMKQALVDVRADRDRILKGYEDLLVQHEQVRARLERAENKLIIRS